MIFWKELADANRPVPSPLAEREPLTSRLQKIERQPIHFPVAQITPDTVTLETSVE